MTQKHVLDLLFYKAYLSYRILDEVNTLLLLLLYVVTQIVFASHDDCDCHVAAQYEQGQHVQSHGHAHANN